MQYSQFAIHLASLKESSSIYVKLDFGVNLSVGTEAPPYNQVKVVSDCCGAAIFYRYQECSNCRSFSNQYQDPLYFDIYGEELDLFVARIFDRYEAKFDPLERIIFEQQLRDDLISLRVAYRSAWRASRKTIRAIDEISAEAVTIQESERLLYEELKKWMNNPRTRKSRRFSLEESNMFDLFPERVSEDNPHFKPKNIKEKVLIALLDVFK